MPLAVDTARQVVRWIGMVGKAEMVVSRHRGRAFHLSVIPLNRKLEIGVIRLKFTCPG